MVELTSHHEPQGTSDRIALGITKFLRFFADTFFAKRYGHRAIVLETVAAVPGMVGGMMNHLKSLRRMRDDDGWIRELLDEAENERMHLMAFVALFKPTAFERFLVLLAQGVFWNLYFLVYLFAPRTAHRTVGYFEEEAIISYTEFLKEIDAGEIENVPAPQIAIDYWKLSPNARLRELVIAVRADEAKHRDVNHAFVDKLDASRTPGERLEEDGSELPENPEEQPKEHRPAA
ncbi:MAG TPA: alternative oxidase [Hyphomonadaceae bacterium]|nr:alternative oxidase [Hyphomonadaceae bacterium]